MLTKKIRAERKMADYAAGLKPVAEFDQRYTVDVFKSAFRRLGALDRVMPAATNSAHLLSVLVLVIRYDKPRVDQLEAVCSEMTALDLRMGLKLLQGAGIVKSGWNEPGAAIEIDFDQLNADAVNAGAANGNR